MTGASRIPSCLLPLLLGMLASCEIVDLGAPPAEINACRPSALFFMNEVWPNYLAKPLGGKRCSDGGCHAGSSARQLVMPPPASAVMVPMPPDWATVYRSVTEQIQCTNVGSSPLLTRPNGRQVHGGGKLIEPDGEEERLVRKWVVAP